MKILGGLGDSDKSIIWTNKSSDVNSSLVVLIYSVVATVRVGINPYGAGYDNRTGQVIVTNEDPNGFPSTVSVISDETNTVLSTVNVGTSPIGVTYDYGKGWIFVANYGASTGSGTVTVISDGTGGSVGGHVIPVDKVARLALHMIVVFVGLATLTITLLHARRAKPKKRKDDQTGLIGEPSHDLIFI